MNAGSLAADASGRELQITTPEQVTLRFVLASVVTRAVAVLIDLSVIAAALSALGALAWMVFPHADDASGVLRSGLYVLAFFLRSFYFLLFELRWKGRTPGKAKTSIRVIARDGGPLHGNMVIARNLMREIELFLPLQMLFIGSTLPWLPAGVVPLAVVTWLVVANALVPLIHRSHARLGDLVAGTAVVTTPATSLLDDLVAPPASRASTTAERRSSDMRFTSAQLDVYGIRELQVLEEVLRHPARRQDSKLLAGIALRIKRRIDWPREDWNVNDREFLQAFYAAQRGRLEKELLFGERREHKRPPGT